MSTVLAKDPFPSQFDHTYYIWVFINVLFALQFQPVIFRELFETSARLKGAKGRKKGEKEIKRFSVRTETLSKAPGEVGALVSVEPTTTAWNFIPVYMAEMLSPVIGDFHFAYRYVLTRVVKFPK